MHGSQREAQDIADAVLDAEVRIGELMKQVPKSSGGDHGNQYTGGKNDTAVDFAKPKSEVIRDAGFTPKQVPKAPGGQPYQERSTSDTAVKSKKDVIEQAGLTTKQVPKNSGGDRRSIDFKNDTAVDFEKNKSEVIRDAGFTPKQVERFR